MTGRHEGGPVPVAAPAERGGLELADLLRVLRRRWRLITGSSVLGCLAALALTLLATPVYSATSQVFVSVRGTDSTADLLQGSSFTVRQVSSYVQLVQSPRVLERVVDALALTATPFELAERVRAEAPVDTVLINITADALTARDAADIANATADSLAVVVGELEAPQGGAPPTVQISTVRTAVAPLSPSSPDTLTYLALGLLIGLAAGVGLTALREALNTTLRDVADVEELTGRSVLAAIPDDPNGAAQPLGVGAPARSPLAEAFRKLRTNLQFLEATGTRRAIVIASSLPGEGKSITSINLAITLADAGQRVVLVDADLRRPRIGAYLALEGAAGLTTVLIGRAEVTDVVQPWGSGRLDVITSGLVPPNPSELLGSSRMDTLVDELAARYDVVLIDSPPLLPVTDGAVLARLVGGALFLIGSGVVHRHEVVAALGALQTVGASVLGVVANRVPDAAATGYYDVDEDRGQPATRLVARAQEASARVWPPVGNPEQEKV